MKYRSFQLRKNDVFFAFLMAVVFAITVMGQAAAAFNVARDYVVADIAARQAADDKEVLVSRAGVRK